MCEIFYVMLYLQDQFISTTSFTMDTAYIFKVLEIFVVSSIKISDTTYVVCMDSFDQFRQKIIAKIMYKKINLNVDDVFNLRFNRSLNNC